jgi:hypothetical protein
VLNIPHSTDDIKNLPLKLDTLKMHCRRQLPLLPVQRRKVSVDPSVQPTRSNASSEQPFESYTGIPRRAFSRYSELAVSIKDALRYEYVNHPAKLWHCRAWGSSILTVSGQFVSTSTGDILFPSGLVEFEPVQVASLEIPVNSGGLHLSAWISARTPRPCTAGSYSRFNLWCLHLSSLMYLQRMCVEPQPCY